MAAVSGVVVNETLPKGIICQLRSCMGLRCALVATALLRRRLGDCFVG